MSDHPSNGWERPKQAGWEFRVWRLPLAATAALRAAAMFGNVRLRKPRAIFGVSQRVHVGTWYTLRAQSGSHIPTLRARYIPYSYMDPLGLGSAPTSYSCNCADLPCRKGVVRRTSSLCLLTNLGVPKLSESPWAVPMGRQ